MTRAMGEKKGKRETKKKQAGAGASKMDRSALSGIQGRLPSYGSSGASV